MDEREDFHRWNERFQAALELPEPHDCSATRLEKYEAITSVQRDFLSVASTAARTLISELFLPAERKSVVPRQVGGIAGGRKLELHGILFKLADGRVARGPYQGDDEAAAKALAHELKSADQILKCGIGGVHVALQCRVDFRGFRVLAQARLPIAAARRSSSAARTRARARGRRRVVQRCGFVAHEFGPRATPSSSAARRWRVATRVVRAAGGRHAYAAAATACAGHGANAPPPPRRATTRRTPAPLRCATSSCGSPRTPGSPRDGRHYLLDLAAPSHRGPRAPHLPGAAAPPAGRGRGGSRTIFWRLCARSLCDTAVRSPCRRQRAPADAPAPPVRPRRRRRRAARADAAPPRASRPRRPPTTRARWIARRRRPAARWTTRARTVTTFRRRHGPGRRGPARRDAAEPGAPSPKTPRPAPPPPRARAPPTTRRGGTGRRARACGTPRARAARRRRALGVRGAAGARSRARRGRRRAARLLVTELARGRGRRALQGRPRACR